MASWHDGGTRSAVANFAVYKDGANIASQNGVAAGSGGSSYYDSWSAGRHRRANFTLNGTATLSLTGCTKIDKPEDQDIPTSVFGPVCSANDTGRNAGLYTAFGIPKNTFQLMGAASYWGGACNWAWGRGTDAKLWAGWSNVSASTDTVSATGFMSGATSAGIKIYHAANWGAYNDDNYVGNNNGTYPLGSDSSCDGRSPSVTLNSHDNEDLGGNTFTHKYFTRNLTSNSFTVKSGKFIEKGKTITTLADLQEYLSFPSDNVVCVHNGTTDTIAKDLDDAIDNISCTESYDTFGQPVVNVSFRAKNNYPSAGAVDATNWTVGTDWAGADTAALSTEYVTYVIAVPVATDYEPTVEFTRKKSVNYGTGITMANLSEYVNIPTKCEYSLVGVEETYEKTTANEIVAVSTDVNALFQTVVIISMRKYKSDADTGEITTEPSTIYKDFSVTIGTKYPINTFVQNNIPNIGTIEIDSPIGMLSAASAKVNALGTLDDSHAVYLTPAVFTTECMGHQLKISTFGQANMVYSALENLPYDGGTAIGQYKTGSEVEIGYDLGTAYYFDTFNNTWSVKAEVVSVPVKAKITPKYKCFPLCYCEQTSGIPAEANALNCGATAWTKLTSSNLGDVIDASATLGLTFTYHLISTTNITGITLTEYETLTRTINTNTLYKTEVVTNVGKGSKNNTIKLYAAPLIYYNLGSPLESAVSSEYDETAEKIVPLLTSTSATAATLLNVSWKGLRFNVGKSIDTFYFKAVSSSSKLLKFSDYDSLTNTAASADIAEFVFGADNMAYTLTFDVKDENDLVTEHSYAYDEYCELFGETLLAGPLSDFVSGGYVQVPNINTYGQFVIENMGTDTQTVTKAMPMSAQANLKCEVLTEHFDLVNVIPLPTQHKFPKKRAEQYVDMTPEQWHEAVSTPGALQIPLYFEYNISPTRKTEQVPFSDLLTRDLVRPQTKFSISWGDATHETIVFEVCICDHFEVNSRGTDDETEDTTKRRYSNHTYIYEVIQETLVDGNDVFEFNNSMYPPYTLQSETLDNAIDHVTNNQKVQAILNSMMAKSRITNMSETLNQLNKAGVVRMVLVRNCVQNLGGGNYGLSTSDQAKCIGVLTDAPNLQKAMLAEARQNPEGYKLNNINWFTIDSSAPGFSWDTFNRMSVGIIEAVQDPDYPHHTYVLFNSI